MSSLNTVPNTIPPELDAEMNPAVRAFVCLLLDRIAKLEARVKELEHERKTPQNSSLPPSSRHPHNRPSLKKRKSKNKRGGQPGHKKHERSLIPADQCDNVQPLRPVECRRCSAKLTGDDPEPLRHQVWELPEIKPLVTEYQRHRLCFPHCGETTCAELPEGVPQGQSGPRLMAYTAMLMAFYRQSKRRTAEFLAAMFGQPCCAALTVKIQNQVTEALRPVHEEAAAELPTQPHLNIDETATKQENGKVWLWTFVARRFTVFSVRPTRAAICKLFEHWSDYRAGKISRAALARRMGPVRRKTERSLRHAVIWRTLSFGTQSARGSRFVETMLTVIETCRQQCRNAFTFITNAAQAHLSHQSTPSLIPRV